MSAKVFPLPVAGSPQRQTVTINLDEISTMIFVREQTDQERVQFFKELLKDGHELDPVEIGRKNGEIYLLDGIHRLEAHKVIGAINIDAFENQTNPRLWTLEAVRLNSRSSKPLSQSEIKKAVRDARVSGLTVEEIIQHLNGVIARRTVERYIKPIAQQKEQKHSQQIEALKSFFKNKGATIRTASEELGITRSQVHRLMQKIKAEQKNIDGEGFKAYFENIRQLLVDVSDKEEQVLHCVYLLLDNEKIDDIEGKAKLSKIIVASIAIALLYLYDYDQADLELNEIFPAIQSYTKLIIWLHSRLKKSIPDRDQLVSWVVENCLALNLSDRVKKIVRQARVNNAINASTSKGQIPSKLKKTNYQGSKPGLNRAIFEDEKKHALDVALANLVAVENSLANSLEELDHSNFIEQLNRIKIVLNAIYTKIRKVS